MALDMIHNFRKCNCLAMENISTHLFKKDYIRKGTYNLLSQACDKINNVYYSFLNIATSHERNVNCTSDT